ncbi:hypothetical protein MLD38_022517 [Melastoma candidum]|uniref:Uncharacterized protein n=1 Tax=Melastoma candidum TaxID=119954 RepID=A0ACB9QJI6_9MYRT|nr:hypothetical protein MLD38_022517 [Melastoma candidum]
MYPGGYTVEVTYLSPNATEKEVYDFFSHCGAIEHIEILRSGEYSRTAYVTFKDAYAVETAVLLSGASIADQRICITHWGGFMDESDPFSHFSRNSEGDRGSTASQTMLMVSSPGEAVTATQEVVKTLIAKGYILGKDALAKARAFDESHQVSSAAISKVTELSDRIGLTSRINAGMDVVRSIDERYHVTDMTKSAIYVTGTTVVVAASAAGEVAAAAASAVASSSYFSRGALWVSDALSRAAEAAAGLASQGSK